MLFDFPFEFQPRKLVAVAYTYEAAVHCTKCAEKRFGPDLVTAADKEGNYIHPEYRLDQKEWCNDCAAIIPG